MFDYQLPTTLYDASNIYLYSYFLFSEKLSAVDMGPLTEVTQSVSAQKQKLGQLLDKINEITGSAGEKWNKDRKFMQC